MEWAARRGIIVMATISHDACDALCSGCKLLHHLSSSREAFMQAFKSHIVHLISICVISLASIMLIHIRLLDSGGVKISVRGGAYRAYQIYYME